MLWPHSVGIDCPACGHPIFIKELGLKNGVVDRQFTCAACHSVFLLTIKELHRGEPTRFPERSEERHATSIVQPIGGSERGQRKTEYFSASPDDLDAFGNPKNSGNSGS